MNKEHEHKDGGCCGGHGQAKGSSCCGGKPVKLIVIAAVIIALAYFASKAAQNTSAPVTPAAPAETSVPAQ